MCINDISEFFTSFAISIALSNARSEMGPPSCGTRIVLNVINCIRLIIIIYISVSICFIFIFISMLISN